MFIEDIFNVKDVNLINLNLSMDTQCVIKGILKTYYLESEKPEEPVTPFEIKINVKKIILHSLLGLDD